MSADDVCVSITLTPVADSKPPDCNWTGEDDEIPHIVFAESMTHVTLLLGDLDDPATWCAGFIANLTQLIEEIHEADL